MNENPLSFENFARTVAEKLRSGGKVEAERYAAEVQKNVAWDAGKLMERGAILAKETPQATP